MLFPTYTILSASPGFFANPQSAILYLIRVVTLINSEAYKPVMDEFAAKARAYLAEKGFLVESKLGEGHTREVYKATRGNISYAIKIPHFQSNSLQTLINHKNGRDMAEIAALERLKHPNIVQLIDAFELDGQIITIEEDFGAHSLESHIHRYGSIHEPQEFSHIISQIVSTLGYMHCDAAYLHRDLKPSNVLINSNNIVKLTDFQNASPLETITEKLTPTRGGTKYTPPEMINSLIHGKHARASLQSDLYALSLIAHFVYTGQDLFDYTITIAPESGQKIQLRDEQIPFVLKHAEKTISQINVKEHYVAFIDNYVDMPTHVRSLIAISSGIGKRRSVKRVYNELERYLTMLAMQGTNDAIAGKQLRHYVDVLGGKWK